MAGRRPGDVFCCSLCCLGRNGVGMAGVFIAWEASSQVAPFGELEAATAWRWRSGSVGRGRREGHGMTSRLSLHGAAAVGPGVSSGGGQPPGKVGAAWTATSERPWKRGRWALLEEQSTPS